jgi:hypothetical protein
VKFWLWWMWFFYDAAMAVNRVTWLYRVLAWLSAKCSSLAWEA